ncbi:TPA: hypothetical protein N0F65_007988 [Lagenidium giganteum]|uniref:Transmembrane protein n=1 Tax=Lagenidium giganteum TaxID=4803 RepID=A0AAV2YSS8_9STRA|nr:TPA: hypothetical protein N0F65_007988 [Lagenidium giganteum]
MPSTLMFCQFFLSSEAKKLAANWVLTTISSFLRPTWPMATFKHMTFFIWNLMVARTWSAFSVRPSFDDTSVGNLPALLRPGPSRRGICLIKVSEAKKASYFLANFLITFLFLLNFFRSSTVMYSKPSFSASSQCTALPSTQIFMFGRGTVGSLNVPEKRLSFFLERNLQLDGLVEVTLLALHVLAVDLDLLALREGEDVIDGLGQQLTVQLAHGAWSCWETRLTLGRDAFYHSQTEGRNDTSGDHWRSHDALSTNPLPSFLTEMRQEPDENEATGTCASDRNSASDPHFLPVNAAKLTQSLIGLSDEQRQVLEKELNRTDEDPLLVLRFNPNWQGQVAVGTVCDAIATFGMRGGARRDSGEGCHGWVFHFDHYQDLGPCKTAIALAHPEAFAFSPRAITRAEAAFGAAARANLPTEPLAYAVVINKIAIRQDDAGSLEFFYL